MIVGSGMLARAFEPYFGSSESECVFAAGVSNSACTDRREFDRELARLTAAIASSQMADLFLYFGTCSANAPVIQSPYVEHKIAMERLAATHARCLVVRLPQVAGRGDNPHTLLNYIFHRVSRSERFEVWGRARRNVIDVEDAARMVMALAREGVRRERVDVANSSDTAMTDIVQVMAKVVGKPPICDVVDCGNPEPVNVDQIGRLAECCGVTFDDEYLERVLTKYYGRPIARIGM